MTEVGDICHEITIQMTTLYTKPHRPDMRLVTGHLFVQERKSTETESVPDSGWDGWQASSKAWQDCFSLLQSVYDLSQLVSSQYLIQLAGLSSLLIKLTTPHILPSHWS